MALRKFIFFNANEGFSEEQQPTDELSLGKVTAVGVGGVGFDAGSNRITNVATPTAGSDAVNRDYVQAYAAGLDWKQSVRLATAAALPANTPAGSGVGKTLTADANGALSVDGVAVVAGDRILVKDQGSEDNGIYVVTAEGDGSNPFILTRATDADQDAEVTANLAVFVEEGTNWADTGWTLTTNNPIVVDTTTLIFTQFTGTGGIIAGSGLLKTGAQIDVELDTGADAQGTGNGGGSSGLEFDVSGAGGKLRAKVDPAGGIQRGASGLLLEIDDSPDTLDVGANGLKVVGVPLSFKIDGVATSSNLTAANANSLVDVADASGLHYHQKSMEYWTASGGISKGDGVYVSGNNVASTGDCSNDSKSRIIGVADAAISDTASGPVLVSGPCTGILSGATAGTPYYLGTSGAPVLYAALTTANRVIRLGFAKNATDLEVRVFDYGKRA